MTLLQFRKLKVGDEIMNRRQPGIVLRVTNRKLDVHPEGTTTSLELESSAGRTWVHDLRHKEYQMAYPQLKLPL